MTAARMVEEPSEKVAHKEMAIAIKVMKSGKVAGYS